METSATKRGRRGDRRDRRAPPGAIPAAAKEFLKNRTTRSPPRPPGGRASRTSRRPKRRGRATSEQSNCGRRRPRFWLKPTKKPGRSSRVASGRSPPPPPRRQHNRQTVLRGVGHQL